MKAIKKISQRGHSTLNESNIIPLPDALQQLEIAKIGLATQAGP